MRRALRAIWDEPAAPNPSPPARSDWIFTASLVAVALIEAALHSFAWKPAQLLFVVTIALALPWRRTHPLTVAGSAFAAFSALNVASAVVGISTADGFYVGAFMLILPYSLVRWGSGPQWIAGLALMVLTPWTAVSSDFRLDEAVGGTVFMLLPAAIGATVRYWNVSRERAVGEARLQERGLLARELHDTVAHHVSAIAIQAQAGRTLGTSDPEAAMRALEVVEKEASRTLSEMRAMVGVLRKGERADMAPLPGIADIDRLTDSTHAPRVDVQLRGDLEGLPPAVNSAIYRMAQESITNARRHARQATSVAVEVTGDRDCVRLLVRDDGEGIPHRGEGAGFGLAGMAERAELLGGSFSAGPNTERGWLVEAVIPRDGSGS